MTSVIFDPDARAEITAYIPSMEEWEENYTKREKT